jgi:thiamine biosynthesis lipoprotein
VARALRVWLVVAMGAAAGCDSSPPAQTLQFLALGTIVEITAVDDHGRLPATQNRIEQHLEDWGREMYAFGNGELAQANAAFARQQCVETSPRLARLIRDAQRFERRHAGMFNAGLADLSRLWGLHEPNDSTWQPPDRDSIADLVSRTPRALNIELEANVACPAGNVGLDVGGFAKGHIINELRQMLEDGGIANAIINVGGDLQVHGRKHEMPWRVAIRDPRAGFAGALARIALDDGEAAFTSGNYERHRDFEGRRYGHILDPLSGDTLSAIASVTVIGRDATATDAAATALYVAASRAHARDETLSTLAAVADASDYVIVDAKGTVFVSSGLKNRVELFDSAGTTTVNFVN